jgi:alkylation response protein AidB-like acyl-CoA dehydrogenase
MTQQIAERRDIDFVIWEQMDCEQILEHQLYKEYNKKSCEMIISEARALAIKELLPTLAEGDAQGVRYENGTVKVPDCFHRVYELIREGEWNNLGVSSEMGGQGAPTFVAAAAAEYFLGANWPLYCYATMGNGTANMIQLYGTLEQKDKYVKKLTAAEWGGTMLLTEPEAGSDVGALTTTAVKNADGTYSLSGNKIFITNGEHDLVGNIINPVLARIEGDPAGTKGISIFLVPKYFVNEDGSPGDRNDIVCTGVEEKHGIHGSATCSMALGSKGKCIGYLLGEERQGMKIMFNMINTARMSTGLQALAYASSAYLLAVNYARERIQGRDLYVDGMRSFFYFAIFCGAKAFISETEEKQQFYGDLFEILTPIIKDYLAVKGHEVCVQAIQVFGGAGYTKDYLVEQYARDCKITSIFEGTSGIQAMDLLARKIGMKKGMVWLEDAAGKVEQAANRLGETALHIGQIAMSAEFKVAFAHALPFLYAMGDTIMAWMLLWRATVADQKLTAGINKKDRAFYDGQIKAAEFFINTELPVTMGKMNAIEAASAAAIEIEDDAFGGR